MAVLNVSNSDIPLSWRKALQTISEKFPGYFSDTSPLPLTVRTGDKTKLTVSTSESGIEIQAGTHSAFLRGLGCAMSGVNAQETVSFDSIGVMLDCSRNRVYRADSIEELLPGFALAGYNRLMLYAEDVYELPDEPAFGYMRGRYSMDEIRRIETSASKLGMEVSACIQTLGHLENLFSNYQYADIRDTRGILLADEEKTYALIEKMICFWANALSSKKLHIGMDETHDLGRGAHLDRFGYEEPSEIYLRHLRRVCAICQKFGLTPVIWSDMLLRFEQAEKPQPLLPENLELCYWNYSGSLPEDYEKDFKRHTAFGRPFSMASSVCSYNVFCCFTEKMERSVPACVTACTRSGVRDILFTVWGDAGAFCNLESIVDGLFFAADVAFGEPPENRALSAALFRTVRGEDEALFREISKLHRIFGKFMIPAPGLLWEDPLQGGIYSFCFSKYPEFMTEYRNNLKSALKTLSHKTLSASLAELFHAANLLSSLLDYREELLSAYAERDRNRLRRLVEQTIPDCIEKGRLFDEAFRMEWMYAAKPFGLEIIQRRNAGLIARLKETALRLNEFLARKNGVIEELEEALSAAALKEFHPATQVFSGSLEIY